MDYMDPGVLCPSLSLSTPNKLLNDTWVASNLRRHDAPVTRHSNAGP